MPVALDDVAASMSELLRRTLAGVELEFVLEAENRGVVVGDQAQLEQVLLNLVVNARDAVDGNGRVAIRTDTVEIDGAKWVRLEVADNGHGIPADLRDRVFEPYFTTKTKGQERGTGLGLATVFGIVEGHGGAIEIDAGLDGRGTTFRVTLPAAACSPETTESGPSDLPTGSGTVLVVDDDRIVRSALVTTVESLGYQVLAASTGAEAVALFAEHRDRIQVVLLDMVMHGMNGRSTYLALRDIDPDVRVILMSGYVLNDEVQAILDLGVRTFLSKPYSVELLATTLVELVR